MRSRINIAPDTKEQTMVWKFILPVLAAAMLIFAVAYTLYIQRPQPETPPPVAPPHSPFGQTVAGAGMVEPNTEASGTAATAVGSQLSGVVTRVHVSIAQTVKAGDLLFELDSRQAEAELRAREATLQTAQAQLRRLELQPRQEELPVSEAQVDAAKANLRQQEDQYKRAQQLVQTKAIPQEEFVIREQMFETAKAQVALARASLALLQAGAWQPDKSIAAANIAQAEAQVQQTKTTLDMLKVRAPADGTILQLKVRPGEFVSTQGGQSLIVMGNLEPLHVHVNVDEEDIPRLVLDAPARAKIRGDLAQEEVSLTFVRLEPYVVPKSSLTGINTERVDTRVAQLIYAIDPRSKLVHEHKLLVGQLVDVFIDARPSSPSRDGSAGKMPYTARSDRH
jgi:HlyD family secretion protein